MLIAWPRMNRSEGLVTKTVLGVAYPRLETGQFEAKSIARLKCCVLWG